MPRTTEGARGRRDHGPAGFWLAIAGVMGFTLAAIAACVLGMVLAQHV